MTNIECDRLLAENNRLKSELDLIKRELSIVQLSIPMEDELSDQIDEMLRHIAMQQGFTMDGIARLLRECQKRMASDWSEIGRLRMSK